MDGGRAAAAACDPCPSRRPGHRQPQIGRSDAKGPDQQSAPAGVNRSQKSKAAHPAPAIASRRPTSTPWVPVRILRQGVAKERETSKTARRPCMAPAHPFCIRRGALRVSPAGRPPTSIAPGPPRSIATVGTRPGTQSQEKASPRTTRRGLKWMSEAEGGVVLVPFLSARRIWPVGSGWTARLSVDKLVGEGGCQCVNGKPCLRCLAAFSQSRSIEPG